MSDTDKPETTSLQQHRFIEAVVLQSAAYEPNTQLVAPTLESPEINCSALLLDAGNFGDLAYGRAENLRVPRYKGEFQVKCRGLYDSA